jgi:hypothetical protein
MVLVAVGCSKWRAGAKSLAEVSILSVSLPKANYIHGDLGAVVDLDMATPMMSINPS